MMVRAAGWLGSWRWQLPLLRSRMSAVARTVSQLGNGHGSCCVCLCGPPPMRLYEPHVCGVQLCMRGVYEPRVCGVKPRMSGAYEPRVCASGPCGSVTNSHPRQTATDHQLTASTIQTRDIPGHDTPPST